ncbi:hypothetical protein SHKM778_42420 [Streptomyces sp. KM77-8]|uniref:Uncharacterized protein n=1 Tax=Streptomyces haneummycinicus TaxID=3074435 RepID=A0AAT9HKF4_9ACTN
MHRDQVASTCPCFLEGEGDMGGAGVGSLPDTEDDRPVGRGTLWGGLAHEHDGAPRAFRDTGPDGTGEQASQEGIVPALTDDQREGVFRHMGQDVDGFPRQYFGLDPDLGAAPAGPGFGAGDDLLKCGGLRPAFREIFRGGGAFEAFPHGGVHDTKGPAVQGGLVGGPVERTHARGEPSTPTVTGLSTGHASFRQQ